MPARWRWRPLSVGLAQSRRWSLYLPAQPRRARPAAAPAAASGGSRGEHSVRPRAPRRRSHSQHSPPPSLSAAAQQQCPPASRRAKPGGPARAGRRQTASAGPATLAARGLHASPPGGELSPGTFSPAASACVCDAVAPPARSSRLPSPPLPPASHPPPQHVYSSPRARSPVRSSLPPREAQLLTNIIAPPPPLWSRNNPFSTLGSCCREEQVLATQGLSELGFLSRGRSCAGSPRPPRRPAPPAPPPPPRGGRCTGRLIARAELTNRLAPSQQAPAPAPAGTRSCRALGAGGGAGGGGATPTCKTLRVRQREKTPELTRPRHPELSF